MNVPTIRKVPLITGETYHIFNRGIDGRITFQDNNEYSRFYQAMSYYIFASPPIRLSRYVELSKFSKAELSDKYWGDKLVTIMAYCLMPNHFHIMLRQEVNGGSSHFIGQLLNSYTRYFNTKNNRVGQLFLDQFKNVLVENDNQLMHLSRYIHLNPYSSGVVDSREDLLNYKWCSLQEYIHPDKNKLCESSVITSHFKNISDYKKFVFDNADYQKSLKMFRHLVIE